MFIYTKSFGQNTVNPPPIPLTQIGRPSTPGMVLPLPAPPKPLFSLAYPLIPHGAPGPARPGKDGA